jgi:hypothetical protein
MENRWPAGSAARLSSSHPVPPTLQGAAKIGKDAHDAVALSVNLNIKAFLPVVSEKNSAGAATREGVVPKTAPVSVGSSIWLLTWGIRGRRKRPIPLSGNGKDLDRKPTQDR